MHTMLSDVIGCRTPPPGYWAIIDHSTKSESQGLQDARNGTIMNDIL